MLTYILKFLNIDELKFRVFIFQALNNLAMIPK